jgi:hypothetical protein
MKALWINATDLTVSAVDYTSLADMQRLVGGDIEAAYYWENGDVLYVDEEGLYRSTVYFRITVRPDQPLAGNGLLVGPEIGATINTRTPTMTLDKLRSIVTWVVVL